MKLTFCVLISLLIGVSTFAQPEEAEGSHYLFPEFISGTVLMKDGTKNYALLNYNSLTEEMVFERNGQYLAFTEQEVNRTDTVFIKDRKFIVMNGSFVECLHQSNWDLYAEYKCRLKDPGKPAPYGGTSHTSSADTYSTLVTGGQIYELKLPNYEVSPYVNYWLNRNGELSMFRSMRQLKKLYNDKKALYNSYVKEHEVSYDNAQSLVQLIDYLESNQNT